MIQNGPKSKKSTSMSSKPSKSQSNAVANHAATDTKGKQTNASSDKESRRTKQKGYTKKTNVDSTSNAEPDKQRDEGYDENDCTVTDDVNNDTKTTSSRDKSASQTTSESPRCRTKTRRRRSLNKIYKAPRTPSPADLLELERGFTLDCIAVNTMSRDYSMVRPKVGQIVPPYNSQRDKAAKSYFQATGVNATLRKNCQIYPGDSIEEQALDRFHESGAGYEYLSRRNIHGAGHSIETTSGHSQFMLGLKPIEGYNGRFGYKRNRPDLRLTPSTFGLITKEPIH